MKSISFTLTVLITTFVFCVAANAGTNNQNDLGIPAGTTNRGTSELDPRKQFKSNVSYSSIDKNGYIRTPGKNVSKSYYSDTDQAFKLVSMAPTSSTASDFNPTVKPQVYTPNSDEVPAVEPESSGSSGNETQITIHQGNKIKLYAPVQGAQIVSGFGYRRNPFNGRSDFHPGLDFFRPGINGAPIYASANGIVSISIPNGNYYGYGKFVEIKHNDIFSTRYGHCSRVIVRKGQVVRKGQLIGYVGTTGASTGPHLHFELRYKGKAINPVPFF